MHRPRVGSAQNCAAAAILALVIVSSPAVAQSWTAMPAFNGGNWTECAASPSGAVFVTSDVGILYRSSDMGGHWSNVTPATVRSVNAMLEQPYGVVFAGMMLIGIDGDTPAIFQSADDGSTWSLIATLGGSIGPVAGMGQTSAGTMLAVTTFGNVWRSVDSGSTWNLFANVPAGANPVPRVHDVLVDDSSGLLVANDNGLYQSANDGSSWANLYLSGSVFHLAANPVGTADYFSTAGNTYQLIDGPIQVPGASGGALCPLSDGSLLIDGRERYDGSSVMFTPAQLPGTVNQAAVISGTSLIVATSDGIFLSADNLSSFGDAAPPSVVSTAMIGAVGTSGVIANAGDGSFVSRFIGDPMHRTNLVGLTKPIAVAPTPTGGFAASRDGGVFRSDDGGLTWVLSGSFENKHVQALALGSGLVLVGDDGTLDYPLYASSDNGVSWAPSDPSDPLLLPGTDVTALAVAGGTCFAGILNSSMVPDVLVSTNAAGTWTSRSAQGLPGPINRLAALSATELYAACQGGLLKSSDGGATWGAVLSSSYGVTSLVVDEAGRVWAATTVSPYVLLSPDHGGSWAPAASGTAGVIGSLALSPSQELYAGGSAGGYRSAQPLAVGMAAQVVQFGLRLAGPNPTHGALRLACSVEHAGPVSLSVIDVTGRCVARTELVAPAPGTWNVTLVKPREPGMYFARAEQDGRVSTARAAIVQ